MKKPPATPRRIGLIANIEKPACRAHIRRAAELVRRARREVLCDAASAALAGFKSAACPDMRTLARESDLLIVFGGDGTMLRVAREVAGTGTPILGINVGNLGFLTAVPSNELGAALEAVWAGRFTVQVRPLIEARGRSLGRVIDQTALNDFVISRGAASRMISLDVSVDGLPLTRYRCDGLILSSPTGSTAYSLSAGGAIVSPDAEVLTLTPICPHALTNRSVVVSLDSAVLVKVISPKPEVILAADGQVETNLAEGESVTVRRSRQSIRLVQLEGSSFFKTLRHKLNWTGSSV
jgi:NAD+ kinase